MLFIEKFRNFSCLSVSSFLSLPDKILGRSLLDYVYLLPGQGVTPDGEGNLSFGWSLMLNR